jgi:hypothetical protein
VPKPLLPGLVEELQEVENEEELRGLREDKLKAIPVLSPNSSGGRPNLHAERYRLISILIGEREAYPLWNEGSPNRFASVDSVYCRLARDPIVSAIDSHKPG